MRNHPLFDVWMTVCDNEQCGSDIGQTSQASYNWELLEL